MIYSQQIKQEVKANQFCEGDTSKLNVQQLQALKNQEIQERREFLFFMSDHIIHYLDIEEHDYRDEVFQTIKNIIVRMTDKPFWILGDLIVDLLQQLEAQLVFFSDDYTVLNQVKLIISSFNAQYSNKFNQITTHHLQNLMSNQNSIKQQLKRVSHYIEVHELIPNQTDRVDEINQKFQSFIQSSDNFVCMDSWFTSFCHASGIFVFKKDSLSTFQVKKMNIDIIQIDTYGIDSQTAKNLFFLLPDYEVILPQLLSTINITKGNFQHTLQNIYDCQVKTSQYPNPFILKGKGIVCCNNEGFQANELVTFYFGEVYTPQRWFEKQTIFHKRMQDGNKKFCQLSPYAEFQINEDLLFIDPTRYGNMAQNISYSCEPNCRLVTIVINSQNFLAVLTSKKILYLEELTLPFPSSSSDPCLCGSIFCKRQQQLDSYNNRIASIYPNYIQRNVVLLQSTIYNNLNHQADLPYWLSNWERINQQQDHYNIKSCVDKVKFVLNRLKITQPPIYLVNNIFEIFWKNYENNNNKTLLDQSILNEIKIFLNRHFQLKECQFGLNIITKMKKIIDEKQEYAMQLTRMLLLILSEVLLSIDTCKFNNQAFSTVLYFMAFTHTYFSSTQYSGFESKPFEESEFDHIPQPKNKSKLPLTKLYTPQFIWGQLINWNKQTLQNPQSSMAQERRGILCYPSLILSFDKKHKSFPYQCKTREKFLEYFQTKREIQPDLSTWSYKNQYHIYGTIFFEQYFSMDVVGEGFISKIANLGTKGFSEKFQYWLEIEGSFSKDQEMIDDLNKIYESEFKKSIEQFPQKQAQTDIEEIGYAIKKKIKFNNEGTMVEETQFGSY